MVEMIPQKELFYFDYEKGTSIFWGQNLIIIIISVYLSTIDEWFTVVH